MRILTVRQPWAWAIIHGQKDVENRTRNIAGSYRGPVAIHAASREASPYNDVAAEVFRLTGQWVLTSELGAIIGVVDLVGVHRANTIGGIGRVHCCHSKCVLLREDCPGPCSQWAMDGHHHLTLANPRPVEPIPAKGKLGLWTPGAELLARIEAAL